MREGQRYVPITEEYYSELAYQKYRKSLLPVNTPCVVTIGSLGKKMCLTDEPSFTNQAVNAVIPNENFDGVFLYYCLRTRLPYVKQLDSGTTSGRENVSKSSFSNIVIEAPSLAIQKRIASILSAYDNLIENNNKRIKILEQMAENLYKEWFVRFRFPGHENTPFENGIPKGWKKAKISDLCKFLNGFAFKSEEYCDDGQYRVVTIKNVQDGKFDLDSVEYINTIPPRMPSYCKLSIGDILMSLTGNVGRICYVTTNNCLLNQRVCKIKSEYPWFTYSFFKQDSIFQTLCNIAYGTAQLNLSPVLAGKMKIILPSGTLQKEYEKKVSPIFSHQQSLIEQNQILIKQRDLLLPRLMSGKLAV